MENIFVWRVTYICVHVTQAQFLPTSLKHVSPGMQFLGLGIGGLSHQSCMSLHIGPNSIVGGSIIYNMILSPLDYIHEWVQCALGTVRPCRLAFSIYGCRIIRYICRLSSRELACEIVWWNNLWRLLYGVVSRFIRKNGMHCMMWMSVKTIIRENGKQCTMQMPVKTTLRLYCDNSHLVSSACEIINVLRHSRLVIIDCL